MAEWDNERCLTLIELYRNSPVLWNPKDKDYYKKHLKEDAWSEIGVALNMAGANCKAKMVTLLASYRREKMKVKQGTGTGKGRGKVYESRWFAFKEMKFLQDSNKPMKGMSTQSQEVADKEPGEIENVGAELAKKKAKADPKLLMLKEAFGILKSASEPVAPTTSNASLELRSFLDFILEKMKKYNDRTKSLVQNDIFQIVMRADQGLYEYPRSFNNYPTPNITTAYQPPTNANLSVNPYSFPQINQESSTSRYSATISPPYPSGQNFVAIQGVGV